MPGIFDGFHQFELRPEDSGITLIQSEDFSGVLVPLFWSGMKGPTKDGFERMNLALKSKCETSQ